MRRLFLALFIFIFIITGTCFAYGNEVLRDYDGIEMPKGSFIPVISAQQISTESVDVGTKVKFFSTSDLYLYETKIIPQNTEFTGIVEKVNEPVIGTNASMSIRVTRLKLPDGFEIPMRGYIYCNNSVIIGGELTEPASYDKKPSYRQGYKLMVGFVPGPTRRMGEHTVVASGADLLILLVGPLYITHTVTN